MTEEFTKNSKQDLQSKDLKNKNTNAQGETSQMVSGALKIFNNFDRETSQKDKNYLRLLSALISFGVKEMSRLESIVEGEQQYSNPAIVLPFDPKKTPDNE